MPEKGDCALLYRCHGTVAVVLVLPLRLSRPGCRGMKVSRKVRAPKDRVPGNSWGA